MFLCAPFKMVHYSFSASPYTNCSRLSLHRPHCRGPMGTHLSGSISTFRALKGAGPMPQGRALTTVRSGPSEKCWLPHCPSRWGVSEKGQFPFTLRKRYLQFFILTKNPGASKVESMSRSSNPALVTPLPVPNHLSVGRDPLRADL